MAARSHRSAAELRVAQRLLREMLRGSRSYGPGWGIISMRVGALDLTMEWDRLLKQGKFTRKHKDDQLDIEYGSQRSWR